MEQDFRALLTSAAAVTALAPPSRINWGAHPQGKPLPALVLNHLSGARGMSMSGPDRLRQARVQVDCYAPTYAQAKALARAVDAVAHGHRGPTLRYVEMIAERDTRESGSNEAERPYRVSLDFNVNWRDLDG